jgi:uncharacterized protein (DUF1499 family)
MARRLLLLALLAATAFALLAWPRLNDVTTGQTPEYPDLQDRHYDASEKRVVDAVEEAIAQLPHWTLQGQGKGPAGAAIQAIRRARSGLVDEITVRIRREGGRTVVKVRSRSRTGPVDFGQNARNIRELFAALDPRLRSGD